MNPDPIYCIRCQVKGSVEELARFEQTWFVAPSVARTWAEFRFMNLNVNGLIPIPDVLRFECSELELYYGLAILGRGDLRGTDDNAYIPTTLEAILTRGVFFPDLSDVNDIEALRVRLLREFPDCVEMARRAVKAHEETGYLMAKDWVWVHWGTPEHPVECGVADVDSDGLRFEFQTDWDFPRPIFKKMADEFPTLEFDIFGEGIGDFSGGLIYEGRTRNGVLTFTKQYRGVDMPVEDAAA